jgi:transitional endoplasmic reticulum ATPase
LEDLILDDETRAAISLIASRMQDTARIESLGGTLPTGVLFHGPSGTGKTATARALAKEVGWAFLSVAGPDLLADRTRLDKLFTEAKDIRPPSFSSTKRTTFCATDSTSGAPELTNKLLTIMDGADDRIKDIVWIAATNHPDQIDPALLRSGRFTEKVVFSKPPAGQATAACGGLVGETFGAARCATQL